MYILLLLVENVQIRKNCHLQFLFKTFICIYLHFYSQIIIFRFDKALSNLILRDFSNHFRNRIKLVLMQYTVIKVKFENFIFLVFCELTFMLQYS